MKILNKWQLFFFFLTIIQWSASAQTKLKHDSTRYKGENQVSDLGIGIIFPPDTIDIYNDSSLHVKYWQYVKPDCIDTSCISLNDSIGKRCCPLYYNPVYGVMDYVCLGKTASAYKILVNYSTIKYMPRNHRYEFKSWKNYILDTWGMGVSEDMQHGHFIALKKEPKDNADTINIDDQNDEGGLCPLEVKGSWVRVIYNCFSGGNSCKHLKCPNPQTAWVRWKRNNKLLICIYLDD
jgi:hypothetical protein